MKVRIKIKPTGYINGQPWPEVGDSIDLPDVVVESMGDWVEEVDERPTPAKRPAKGKTEKRPATGEGVETRVGPDAG